MTDARVTASSDRGSIYDLGYRHYEGRRLGRAYAIWSLFVESFRMVWGFGRPTRAKAAPFILVGLYSLIAVFQLAFSAVIANQIKQGENVSLVKYGTYFTDPGLNFFIILFCVAQAPELVCRDQRHHVLPLYFTRALTRFDYALARVGALTAALFVALMVPMVALFVGDVLMQSDAMKAIGDEWPKALPAIPASLIEALGLASLSLALSAFSPRRAYAAIGMIAYFLLMQTVPTTIYELGTRESNWTWASNLLYLRPVGILSGASDFLFGITKTPGFGGSTIEVAVSLESQVAASVAMIAIATGVLLFRYRRMPA